MVWSPWAALLCKFNDNDDEPYDHSFYDDLFTSSGTGKQNLVDFFRDMSHGMLDLSGSKTFGWFTIDKSLNDYRQYFKKVSTKENPNAGRHALVDWAKKAALGIYPGGSGAYTGAGSGTDSTTVDLSKFSGVVVVYNIAVDLFGSLGRMAVVCDKDSMKISTIGQEMGHGYGLNHSRSDRLPKHGDHDYRDPWDIMSTQAFPYFQASHPVYGFRSIGPGLNAANMDNRKWLDYSRVWNTTRGADTTVDLRPLHRRDLTGFLAISIDNFFIEFRMNEGWDAAISAPVVLIHYFEDGHSYLMDSYLTARGDKFEIKEGEGTALYHRLKIELKDIDVGQRKARISIDYKPIRPFVYHWFPYEFESPAIPLTHLRWKDIAIVHEQIVSTPEWPLRPILKSLADISASEQFNNEGVKRTIRREALETIIKIAQKELNYMEIPGGVTQHTDQIHENLDHNSTSQ
jgi:hypothetical protein